MTPRRGGAARLAAALCLSLAGHAAMFWWLGSPARYVRLPQGDRVALQVVLLPEEKSTQVDALAPASPAADPALATSGASESSPNQVTSAPSVPASGPSVPASAPRDGTTVPPTVADRSVPSRAAPASSAEEEYLSADRLSASPRPLDAVVVPFPSGVQGRINLTVRFSIFVDETGTVRQILVESTGVPTPFVQAVRDTFSSVKFSPGLAAGKAVRSLVRLEVSFETPQPADSKPVQ